MFTTVTIPRTYLSPVARRLFNTVTDNKPVILYSCKRTRLYLQEAFEKCWAHSPLRAAACAIHQVSLLTPPAHRCLRQRQRRQRRRRQRQQRQRQRVTEGTAMAP